MKSAIGQVAGVASALIGGAVIAGWYFDIPALVQVLPSLVPMQFNTALGFILAGLILLGLSRRAGVFIAAPSTILALLGTLTLLQYVRSVDFGIDELLMKHTITVETSHPGRMAPHAAFCFALLGIASLLASCRASWAWWSLLAGVAVSAIGSASLFGYLLDMPLLYAWGEFTSMALHTSIAFVVVGFGMYALAARAARTPRGRRPAFAPASVSVAVVSLSLWSWQTMTAQERLRSENMMRLYGQDVSLLIETNLQEHFMALTRIRERWEQAGGQSRDAWASDAHNYVVDISGIRRMTWVDREGVARWIIPSAGAVTEPGRQLNLDDRCAEALRVAQAERKIWASRAVDEERGGAESFVFVPLFPDGVYDGHFLVLFDHAEFLNDTFEWLSPNYGVRVFHGNRSVFALRARSGTDATAVSMHSPYGIDYRIEFTPLPGFHADMGSAWPEATLVLGVLLAGLFSTILVNLQRSRGAYARERELSNELRMQRFAIDRHAIVVVTDPDGVITSVNDRFTAVSGYTPAEIVGRTHRVLSSGVHDEAFYREMWSVMQRGEVWSGEICNRAKNGRLYWVDTTIVPFLDAHGTIERYVVIRTDITERREAEQELRDSYEVIERTNEELERFVYTASHDLKSPIVTAQGFLGCLKHDLAEGRDDRVADLIARVENATMRMRMCIDDLLELSRVGHVTSDPEDVDLDRVVREVVRSHENEAERRAVVVEIGRDLPPVHMDPNRTVELVDNLFTNALKYGASSEGSRVTIGATRNGDTVDFFVRDNGPGIKPEYHEKIFSLFERLDKSQEGTGVGLAIVKRIVENAGGRIRVDSPPDGGTTFTVTLPAGRNASPSGVESVGTSEKFKPTCEVTS